MDLSQKRVLSLEEGCQYLGYKKSYLYKLLCSNRIPYSKPNGKKIFFDREKLEEWMLSNANTTQAEIDSAAATYVTTHK